MIVNRTKLMLTCAAMVAALAGSSARVLAQQRTSEARIRDLVQQAAQIVASGQVGAATTAQQGGQTTAPAAGPTVPLTLDDAVKLALDRNLDIAVQRLNPQISDLAYASVRSIYYPSLTSTIQTASTTQPSTNTIQGTIGSGAPTARNVQRRRHPERSLGGGSQRHAEQFAGHDGFDNQPLPSVLADLVRSACSRCCAVQNGLVRQQLQVTKLSGRLDIQLTSTITNTLSNVATALGLRACHSIVESRATADLANAGRDNRRRSSRHDGAD